jgi:D-galacturonate reductase
MITADLILPSLYHLQRRERIGQISVCARGSASLRALSEDSRIREAFPGSTFSAHPPLSTPLEQRMSDPFSELVGSLPPRQIVVVAVPDQSHYDVIMAALQANQHVVCVKPLVLLQEQARRIGQEARERGLFVGVEYHKRFDRRSLVARRDYRAGKFGELRFGEARLIEPYSYRRSNFQEWFLPDATDPFTYVGCHYVDLVHFITGLRPVEVSVAGVPGKFPNGSEAILWSLGSVRWENGALLSVANGLGYPDRAAGSNDQGMVLYCEGSGASGMIRHDDHDRGVAYSYLDEMNAGGSHYNFVSPDFFRLVPWEGEGLRPVGYGFDSLDALVGAVLRVESTGGGRPGPDALARRQRALREIDEAGFLATPQNSAADGLTLEAGRLSVTNGGRPVRIHHGDRPRVELT